MKKKSFQNVDEYIASHTLQQQNILNKVRSIIRETAPNTREMISYNMPSYKQNRTLVYFAMAKNHLGLYPTASGIQNFKKELSSYKTSKGAIQFSLHDPLPKDLIQKIVEFRVKTDRADTKMSVVKEFFFQLPAPARHALEKIGITKLEHIKKFSEKELLQLHGLGKTSLSKVQAAMKLEGINFLKQ